MIAPQRAVVRPRAISPESGQSLPLEELVSSLLETRLPGKAADSYVIQITGGPGSGKSTALAHLAAVLPQSPEVLFLDDTIPSRSSLCRYVIVAYRASDSVGADAVLELAPWGEDDLIEYLLAVHPRNCGSVVGRLRAAAGSSQFVGSPEICRPVLDAMAADASLASIRSAVERIVVRAFPTPEEWRLAGERCLALLTGNEDRALAATPKLHSLPEDKSWARPLRHRGVQLLLAASWIMDRLSVGQGESVLSQPLPKELIKETARYVATHPPAREELRRILANGTQLAHPMAASLLVAAGDDWRPNPTTPIHLRRGYFADVRWSGVQFPCSAGNLSTITMADFKRADLSDALLNGVYACRTNFREARLPRARMNVLNAWEADFSFANLTEADAQHCILSAANLEGAIFAKASLLKADLSGACLDGACLVGANLEGAKLVGARIEDADFGGASFAFADLSGLPLRHAILIGASFSAARMCNCNLEGVILPDAKFVGANLRGAWLTGSKMPRANFAHANLQSAGLADIDWENADLSHADLRGCTFHMGSTRSGLVFSPYACEGSKTGFYTDEYLDQSFKAPEEIRKANLCGADLRGAKLDNVDFYLVDLRGAKFDPEVEDHLEHCGAILFDREQA